MNIRIDLNEPQILSKVTNDKFGLFIASEWKRLIDPYTPKDTGLLMQTVKFWPWKIEYIQPYSAYMYCGKVYVDPVYNVGGFYSSGFGFWSRPGIKKVPSEKTFEFQKNNPYSTDHWDVKAAQAGQLDKLYRTANNYLNRR